MRCSVAVLTILLCVRGLKADIKNDSIIVALEQTLQSKLADCTHLAVEWLEDFNDKHLGTSEVGKLLHYEEIKPKIGGTARAGDSKGLKKMSMSMMPLIFHVGATSTWLLLTTLLAAKSVAIGLLLLVFKIAVSSAKVASFFTLLKSKSSHHHGMWTPHIEHGRKWSLSQVPLVHQPVFEDWHSYSPSWTPHEAPHPPHQASPAYKTVDQDHFSED